MYNGEALFVKRKFPIVLPYLYEEKEFILEEIRLLISIVKLK